MTFFSYCLWMLLLKLPCSRLKERVKEENKKNLVISPISEVGTYHLTGCKIETFKTGFCLPSLPLGMVLPYFINQRVNFIKLVKYNKFLESLQYFLCGFY